MSFSVRHETSERFSAFWNRREGESPCLGLQVASSGLVAPPGTGGASHPQQIDVARFLQWHEQKSLESKSLVQDAVWTASPPETVPWAEGMLLHENGSTPVGLVEDDRWTRSYVAILQALTSTSRDRFPVSNATFAGITDLLCRLLGASGVLAAKRVSPRRIVQLSDSLAAGLDRLVGLIDRVGSTKDVFLGGLHLWVPGSGYRYREGRAELFSPEEYGELVLPSVRRFLARFDHVVASLGRTAFHLLDLYLTVPEIDAVELAVGTQKPGFSGLLPLVRRIQDQGKALVIRGSMTEEDLEKAHAELAWNGVYLLLTEETLEEARFWSSYIERWWPLHRSRGYRETRPTN